MTVQYCQHSCGFPVFILTFRYVHWIVASWEGSYLQQDMAGLGWIRNLTGGGFPLFHRANVHQRWAIKWAGEVLAFLTVVLSEISK